jgi:hopene-associated glycosyltransferase HpnB
VPFLAFILAVLSLSIWLILTFFRGSFWQLRRFDDDVRQMEGLPVWPSVVAIVPARNESETIGRAVNSLLKQNYRGKFSLIVVDDHSEDGTAALAAEAGQVAGAGARLRVVSASALPNGWTGKLWALQQGVESAAAIPADYFWFTDADIEHGAETLAQLVTRADAQKLDLASLMDLLQARSFAERLLMPAFLYFFLKLYPPKWIADKKAKTAGAAGGCILLRRTMLERIGELAAIKSEVIDDCALARAVKRSGGSIWMGVTRKSVSLRAYESFGEIRDLIARTAFTQLRYSKVLLTGTVLGMLLTYLFPVASTFSSQPALWRIGLTAWALMTVSYLPTVRFYGLSALWATTLPVAALFYTYATWVSAVRYWLGKGGQWKGRTQAPANQGRKNYARNHS